MDRRRSAAGAAQLRQRELMAQRGWVSITTFVRRDTKQLLKELKRARGLDSLHEALDLVLRQNAGEVAGLAKAGSTAKRQNATTKAPISRDRRRPQHAQPEGERAAG